MTAEKKLSPDFNPMSLVGRTIMVTGASSGIGRATAIYASRLGARLVICGRNSERLSSVLSELNGADHIMKIFDFVQLEKIVPWLKSVCTEVGP